MTEAIVNQFVPDYAVHPGEILEEILEAQSISKTEFAERSGLTPKTISWIVTGKNPVTSENAIVFERILGISAEVWNNLDAEFRLFQARQKARDSLEVRLKSIFDAILYRCNVPKCKGYHNYGGRGIKCLFKNFAEFYAYVTDVLWVIDIQQIDGLEIDRIDNDGNYEPGNIRFVTHKENANNRRPGKRLF